MTPTLSGRLQTRLFNVLVVGGIWTLLIAPLLPGLSGVGYLDRVWNAYQVIVWVAFVGLIWELGYHGLQQFRWEKDWPILYALLVGIPEGLLAWFITGSRFLGLTTGGGIPGSAFFVHFATTWVVTWLWIIGPHRTIFLNWRFSGGEFITRF